MKQSFARQHSRHRDSTPNVIHLPPPKPPKPPVVARRSIMGTSETLVEPLIGAEAAIALPETAEPLLTDRTELQAPRVPRMSRQARRKAARAEIKALRRLGHSPERVAPGAAQPLPDQLLAQPTVAEAMMVEPTIGAAPEAKAAEPAPIAAGPAHAVAAAKAPSADATPLPRARSLITAKPRGLALCAYSMRRMFVVRKVRTVPARTDAAVATQLRTLQKELAVLQQSIDRIIDRVAV